MTTTTNKLVDAYEAWYQNDPKQMNALITGACYWDDKVDLMELRNLAFDQVRDHNGLVELGMAEPDAVIVCQLRAALRVLAELHQAEVRRTNHLYRAGDPDHDPHAPGAVREHRNYGPFKWSRA
jgi:hypothetical protein